MKFYYLLHMKIMQIQHAWHMKIIQIHLLYIKIMQIQHAHKNYANSFIMYKIMQIQHA